MRSGMTEELVAMQVEREPLEEPSDVEDPVAAPHEHLHAVVESFHKPAGLPTLKVIRDLIHPSLDRPQKALELNQSTLTHPLAPGPDGALGPRLRVVAFEQVCEVLSQMVGGLDLGRVGEEPLEPFPLLRLEILSPLTKRPHRPLDLGVFGLGQCSLEPLEFLLAHRVGTVAVGPRYVEPIDDDLGPRHFLLDRRARALDGRPRRFGARAQEGYARLFLAVREHRQDLDTALLKRHRHQHDNISVPALECDLVEAYHAQALPGLPVDAALAPAVEEAIDALLRDPELAGRVRHCGVDQHPQGPLLVRLRVRAARLIPRAPLRRRRLACTVGAAIPFGSNLDEDGHVEQGQMAQAHDRIQPMQLTDLPTTAAAPRPFEGALDANEPVPLRISLGREDTHIGQVQRHLNEVVHSDAPSEPAPPSSYKRAPSLYHTDDPSRQFRESRVFE